MMVSKITEITIFESPDGGRTVYVRKPGDTHRHLLSTDQVLEKEKSEYERWMNIFNARQDNPSLDDICAQAEMLYELSKDSE